MWIFLIIAIILGVILFIFTHFNKKKATNNHLINPSATCSYCDAYNECQVKQLFNKENEIIYYDDEELDALKGIPANEYTQEQIKQISEVFHTLQKNEVKDWLNSLQLRNIELPLELRDEIFSHVDGKTSFASICNPSELNHHNLPPA